MPVSQTRSFRLAGVMGFPIAHSRSPVIHNHWLAEHGLAGTYVPLEVRPERLAQALRALPALGFSGCNLTLPHKVLAMDMVDEVEASALRAGAGNCCVVLPDGRLSLHNYDTYGFMEALWQAGTGWQPAAGPAVVLGAGGAARAVLRGLIEAGVTAIRLANRTRASAEALAGEFGAVVSVVDWEQRAAALDGAALLVNTTSLGMKGQPPLDITLDALPRSATVCDIVYVPLETPLLAAARARGNKGVDGLGMLLHQARPAFEAWWGVLPAVTPQLRAKVEATL